MSKTNYSLSFNGSPQREEWEVVAGIFESSVKMEYYRKLSSELHEIKKGKRNSLTINKDLFPEEHTIPKADPNSYIIMKVIEGGVLIAIEDLERDLKKQVNLNFFTQLVDNWIKFVEVNTDVFKNIEIEPY